MRRLESDTAAWHVFARGTRRLELFRDREDYLNFIRLLQYALRASGCLLWAFALMTNHYHLVVRGTSAQLTACMRRLNMMYSTYHNKRYGMEGHAFDGPYKAYRQGSLLLLVRCLAYVFLNPVVGGLAGRPEDYPWSGYRSFVGLPGGTLPIDPSPLMTRIDRDPKKAWGRFHEAMEREAIRGKNRPKHGLTMVEVHSQQFEWLLEHARENPHQLAGQEPEMVAMFWGRQCGISPRAMSSILKDRSPAQVSHALSEFRAKLEKNPDLRSRLQVP
jgi:REP-associated tyrosine transposase